MTSPHFILDYNVSRASQSNVSRLSIGDETQWPQLATCGSVWMPLSFFSLTASAASGSDEHWVGKGHRGKVGGGSRTTPAVPYKTDLVLDGLGEACGTVFRPLKESLRTGPLWLGFP